MEKSKEIPMLCGVGIQNALDNSLIQSILEPEKVYLNFSFNFFFSENVYDFVESLWIFCLVGGEKKIK